MPQLNYITPGGVEKLKNELRELLHVERPQVVSTVAWAASNGDRSENADYIYGKRRLREIDKRVGIQTKKIEEAHIVDPKTGRSDKIVFGATVFLCDEDGQEKVYQIVGEDESHPENGRISWKSPIAKSLLGKKIGDEVVIKRPVGDLIGLQALGLVGHRHYRAGLGATDAPGKLGHCGILTSGRSCIL